MANRCRLQIIMVLMLLSGCSQEADVPPASSVDNDGSDTVAYDSEWNDRNADIYRFLLSQLDEPTPDCIYFITTTPMTEWGDTGQWATIPADELKPFPNTARYRPANEAYLKDDFVLEKGTDAEAWMEWISVKRWISETEVEVEEGVWCCPLGGGASTTIYEKVDGKWRVKEYGGGWVS